MARLFGVSVTGALMGVLVTAWILSAGSTPQLPHSQVAVGPSSDAEGSTPAALPNLESVVEETTPPTTPEPQSAASSPADTTWARDILRTVPEVERTTLGSKSVRGCVFEPTGEPIAGATVSAVPSDSFDRHDFTGNPLAETLLRLALNQRNQALTVATTTDAQGRFQLTSLRDDLRYSLIASHPDYSFIGRTRVRSQALQRLYAVEIFPHVEITIDRVLAPDGTPLREVRLHTGRSSAYSEQLITLPYQGTHRYQPGMEVRISANRGAWRSDPLPIPVTDVRPVPPQTFDVQLRMVENRLSIQLHQDPQGLYPGIYQMQTRLYPVSDTATLTTEAVYQVVGGQLDSATAYGLNEDEPAVMEHLPAGRYVLVSLIENPLPYVLTWEEVRIRDTELGEIWREVFVPGVPLEEMLTLSITPTLSDQVQLDYVSISFQCGAVVTEKRCHTIDLPNGRVAVMFGRSLLPADARNVRFVVHVWSEAFGSAVLSFADGNVPRTAEVVLPPLVPFLLQIRGIPETLLAADVERDDEGPTYRILAEDGTQFRRGRLEHAEMRIGELPAGSYRVVLTHNHIQLAAFAFDSQAADAVHSLALPPLYTVALQLPEAFAGRRGSLAQLDAQGQIRDERLIETAGALTHLRWLPAGTYRLFMDGAEGPGHMTFTVAGHMDLSFVPE